MLTLSFGGLPGGHVREGEQLESALRRELQEELGMAVGMCNQIDTRMLDYDNEVRPVIFYEVENIGGQPRLSEEHVGYQWANPIDLNVSNLGVYKNILIPGAQTANEGLESGDPAASRKAVSPQQIPHYQSYSEDDEITKDGGGGAGAGGAGGGAEGGGAGIAGAGDTMVGEDVHTPAIGGGKRRELKALVEPEEFAAFKSMLSKIGTGGGHFVTGKDEDKVPEGEEQVERPAGHTYSMSNDDMSIKVVKSMPYNKIADTDMKVLYKAKTDKDINRFIVAGYASPVVVDQEGHRVSHKALTDALPKFMALDGEYANANILHSNVTVGKIIPEFTSDDGTVYKTEVDDIGLFTVVEIRTDPFAPDIVKQVIEDIEKGKLKSFSISGNADNPKFMCDSQRCFYDINKVDLYEITICLRENSPIYTRKSGEKPIEDIRVGEEVLTHLGRYCKVVKTMDRQVSEYIIKLETSDGIVELTKEHPVCRLIDGNRYEWVQARNISVGDMVLSYAPVDGEVSGHHSKVKSVSDEYYEGKVYNIEVDEDNSYVTPAAVVHNCEEGVNQDAKFNIVSS